MIPINVAIRTKSPELVEFFYPNYTRMKEFSPFIDGGVIFEGDSKFLQSFRDYNIPYIYTKGTPEYDLTIPENLLNFVFSKWGKSPTKILSEYFSQHDKVNVELENIAKQIWVTGKYTIIDDEQEKMENLYSLMARGSTDKIMKEFLKLADDIDKRSLFFSIQRLLKGATGTTTVTSVWKNNNIKGFVSSRGGNIQSALMSYLYSPADNMELKMLKLFNEITEVKR